MAREAWMGDKKKPGRGSLGWRECRLVDCGVADCVEIESTNAVFVTGGGR